MFSIQMDRQAYNRWSETLTWAFSSVELKTLDTNDILILITMLFSLVQDL